MAFIAPPPSLLFQLRGGGGGVLNFFVKFSKFLQALVLYTQCTFKKFTQNKRKIDTRAFTSLLPHNVGNTEIEGGRKQNMRHKSTRGRTLRFFFLTSFLYKMTKKIINGGSVQRF